MSIFKKRMKKKFKKIYELSSLYLMQYILL